MMSLEITKIMSCDQLYFIRVLFLIVSHTGCGDYTLHEVTALNNPCPLPDSQGKRRSLDDRHKLVYAPMSGVGGVVYDKVGVYINH